MIDFELAFAAGSCPSAAVTLFSTDNSRCLVSYDGENVIVDRSGAAVTDYHDNFRKTFSFPLAWTGEGLTLRVVADQSTLEVFGPGGCSISCEVFSGEGEHKPLCWQLSSGEAALTAHEIPIK
jgi:sucrose-6-phosphate hydrolase SacC (GH32 family)